MKDAVGRAKADTMTVRLVLAWPEAFITIKLTVYDPAAAKVWLGFWAVEVAPSPKFHCQSVGFPVDVSVNWTDWPVAGDEGLKLNEAVSAVNTVTVRVVVFEPAAFVAVSVTVFDPTVV